MYCTYAYIHIYIYVYIYVHINTSRYNKHVAPPQIMDCMIFKAGWCQMRSWKNFMRQRDSRDAQMICGCV